MDAAENRHFEQAAVLRDRIAALRTIFASSEQRDLPENADVLAVLKQSHGVMALIGVRRNGRDLGVHTIRVGQALDADDIEIMQSLIIERYRSEKPPEELIFATDESQQAALKHVLKLLYPKQKIIFHFPKRGARFEWLNEVIRTGSETLSARSSDNQQPAFEALRTMLDLKQTPALLAAVDNAHLGGKQMLSAVVFADRSGPRKDLYRKYKLDDVSKANPVTEGDDYAAMEHVLNRLFAAIKGQRLPTPDVLLIDGGKGQLSVAVDVAHKHDIRNIKLLAVAKGEKRKVGEETLWAGWSDAPLRLREGYKPGVHDAALLLIARVRDEAHRFAGMFLRKRRQKSVLKSGLDDIVGIGKAKRTALLQHFGGIAGVKKASRKQLQEVPGMSIILAERVFQALHR